MQMSVEDRAKRVAEIELESAKKITDATNKVISTKQDLKVVDDALESQYDLINKSIEGNVDAMEIERKKAQEKIDSDIRQIQVLKELEELFKKEEK